MISNEEIEALFKAIDDIAYVKVEGNGYQYELTIVTDIFAHKSRS